MRINEGDFVGDDGLLLIVDDGAWSVGSEDGVGVWVGTGISVAVGVAIFSASSTSDNSAKLQLNVNKLASSNKTINFVGSSKYLNPSIIITYIFFDSLFFFNLNIINNNTI